VAPSLLPTETTDKYIQHWGKVTACTKEQFLYQYSVPMHYSVIVYKSSCTLMVFMVQDQDANFKYFSKKQQQRVF
jgi:hypothetical protein